VYDIQETPHFLTLNEKLQISDKHHSSFEPDKSHKNLKKSSIKNHKINFIKKINRS